MDKLRQELDSYKVRFQLELILCVFYCKILYISWLHRIDSMGSGRGHMASSNHSILVQVMACYVMAPNYNRNQYWVMNREVLCHSHEGNCTGNAENINPSNAFENYSKTLQPNLPVSYCVCCLKTNIFLCLFCEFVFCRSQVVSRFSTIASEWKNSRVSYKILARTSAVWNLNCKVCWFVNPIFFYW